MGKSITTLNQYADKGFCDEQLTEIAKGIDEGLNVSLYARPLIPASEMAYIRKLLYFDKCHKKEAIEGVSAADDYALIDTEFKEYRKSVSISIYEKIIGFALVISGISLIAGLFSILICLRSI